MEWMTSKNFSLSKKFSKFLHQTCTAGLLNPFLQTPYFQFLCSLLEVNKTP